MNLQLLKPILQINKNKKSPSLYWLGLFHLDKFQLTHPFVEEEHTLSISLSTVAVKSSLIARYNATVQFCYSDQSKYRIVGSF